MLALQDIVSDRLRGGINENRVCQMTNHWALVSDRGRKEEQYRQHEKNKTFFNIKACRHVKVAAQKLRTEGLSQQQ